MVLAAKHAKTPLPIRQMLALAVVLLSESFGSTMLLPYVGLLIAHLRNRPAEESGYFSGLMVGVFMLGLVISSKYWGQLSDTYGRRPPLLVGLVSSGLMVLGFGLSTKVWICLLFRFLHGLFNGNALVAKTVLVDILDESNQPKGFTLISLTYGFGTLIGPVVGGLLYDPANSTTMRWAGFSKNGLFSRFPGLLPAIVLCLYISLAVLVCVVFLKESNPRAQPLPRWLGLLMPCFRGERHAGPQSSGTTDAVFKAVVGPNSPQKETSYMTNAEKDSMATGESSHEGMFLSLESAAVGERSDKLHFMDDLVEMNLNEEEEEDQEKEKNAVRDHETGESFGYREAFLLPTTRNVLAMYMLISAAGMAYGESFPLWVVAKDSVGGLGYNCGTVGLLLLFNSVPCVGANLLFHVACHFSTDKMALWRLSAYAVALAMGLSPFATYVPRVGKLIVLLVCCFVREWFSAWAYSLVTLFIARVAPSGSHGTMFGISQSCGAAIRCVIPIVVTPVFAWSISGNHTPPFNHMFVFLLSSAVHVVAAVLSYGIAMKDHSATDVFVEDEAPQEMGTEDARADDHTSLFSLQHDEEMEEGEGQEMEICQVPVPMSDENLSAGGKQDDLHHT